MIVEQALVGALGFDTDTKLTTTRIPHGFGFVVRYLSLESPGGAGDLDVDEVQAILGAGMALMAVQHVLEPGWAPSEALGTEHGTHLVANAVRAGLPLGVTLWNDLEGVHGSVEDTIAYCNAKHAVIRHAGYDSGLYVGAGQPLDEGELYQKLDVARYWRSQSQVPNVAVRGYTMLQLYPSVVLEGLSLDYDVIQKDFLGGLPRWVRSEPSVPRYTESTVT